jgi:hypothetical protein
MVPRDGRKKHAAAAAAGGGGAGGGGGGSDDRQLENERRTTAEVSIVLCVERRTTAVTIHSALSMHSLYTHYTPTAHSLHTPSL